MIVNALQLLEVVEVNKEHAVLCQQPGCGRRVHARVHVVNDSGQFMVLGADCFAKRFGTGHVSKYLSGSGGTGKPLTAEEREMLMNRTAEFVAQREMIWQHERELERLNAVENAAQKEKLALLLEQQRKSAVSQVIEAALPYPWVKPFASVAFFQLRDRSSWLRVQHKDGRQFLMPRPSFDGWDEALPAQVGSPNTELCGYEVGDLVAMVRFMREHSSDEAIVGSWRDVRKNVRSSNNLE